MEGIRQCTKCKDFKLESAYGKFSARASGKHSVCKQCVNLASRNRSKEFPEETKAALLKHMEKRRMADPSLYLWRKARDRVKYEATNREFSITPEDILIPTHCPYLGIELNTGDPDAWASLDRVDSSIGYIKGNIQVVSILANQMKNRATQEQLIAFAKGVLAVHTKEVCRATSSN